MKLLEKRTVYQGKYLRMVERDFITEKGKKGTWEHLERKTYNSKKIVVIFALTSRKEVILERIFRVPAEDWVLELPAGLPDKKGESARMTAKRELLEETGYLAGKLIPIFAGPIAAGLEKSDIIFFFAPGVKFVGQKYSSGEIEEIKVLKVPVVRLVDFIVKNASGMKIDPKILSILPILQKKKLI